MDKTFDVSPREEEEIKREIQRCLEEMKQSFARMDKMQIDTAQSRERTRVLLNNLKTR